MVRQRRGPNFMWADITVRIGVPQRAQHQSTRTVTMDGAGVATGFRKDIGNIPIIKVPITLPVPLVTMDGSVDSFRLLLP